MSDLETAAELTARIKEAARFVPLERLALSPLCGFASTMEGYRISHEQEKRTLELVGRVADSVWGQRQPGAAPERAITASGPAPST